MTDFESLRLKVEDLKMKIAYKSITPVYLGSLLEDFLEKMEDIDMTGMYEPIRDALVAAQKELALANNAISKNAALSTEAIQRAETALQQSATAIANAQAAKELCESVSTKLATTEVVHSVGVTQTPGSVTIDVATGPVDGKLRLQKLEIPEANGYEPGLMSLDHQKRLSDSEEAIRRIDGVLDTHGGDILGKVGYITCDYVVDKVDCAVLDNVPTEAEVSDRHVVWDRSRKAFVLVSHDASYPHCSGGDCWLKWKGMGDYALKDFSKYMLKCDDKCYRFADGDWREIADMDSVAEKCAEVKNEVVTSLEDRFLGVWDEVDSIKEMLAGVVSNEVPGLLKQLGYDDEDIQEYVWANIHLDLGITLEDLRRSAQLWTNWDAMKEFENIAEEAKGFAVMPKCGDDEAQYKFWNDIYRVLYIDSRIRGIRYMPFIANRDINFARFRDIALSAVYISGVRDVKALCNGTDFHLASDSVKGIGRLQNCGAVSLEGCSELRYIGAVECGQVSGGGFCELPYVLNFSGVDVSGECDGDFLFKNFPHAPYPIFNDFLPKATTLPATLRVSQYNAVTKITATKAFMGRRIKGANLTVTNPARGELFDHCWLEDCDVSVPEESGSYMLYTMYNCAAVGVSKLRLPVATELDLRELYGYMRYRSDTDYRWECGRWDVYCSMAQDVMVGGEATSDTVNADYKRRVLLWDVGEDDSKSIVIDYTKLWAVPVSERMENEEELKSAMIESVRSWHDRTGMFMGYVYFSEEQFEWTQRLGIFDELDELFVSKNYSVAIN